MKLVITYCLLFFVFSNFMPAQKILTPLEKTNFKKLTTYSEMKGYLLSLEKQTNLLKVFPLGKTVEDRQLFVCRLSSSFDFQDSSKIKVLFFAQQHGDEPSGMEALLMLIRDIVTGDLNCILDKIDLTIIPQINPDGASINRRLNGNKIDLNRNHLILSEPETTILHEIYHSDLPQLTIDFHEYSPYSKSWMNYGYIKNFDEQVGTLTNPNTDKNIRSFQKEKVLPFVESFLKEKGYSFNEYIVGGPPEKERIRFSTADINDGRQSLGIFGSLSFIIEGKNGKDSIDNIERRTKGQNTAAKAFLSFAVNNSEGIKELVKQTRMKISTGAAGEEIATSFEHISTGETLKLNLLSVATMKDSTVTVNNFNPVVKPLSKVERPLGYLIPDKEKRLIESLKKNNIFFRPYEKNDKEIIYQYHFTSANTAVNEDTKWLKHDFQKHEIQFKVENYVFVELNTIHAKYLVMALDPASMFGLGQYEQFRYFLRASSDYPVLRVEVKR